MITEIDVKIFVREDDLVILETRLGVATSSPISYQAMDYILFETFRNLSNKLQDKIIQQTNKEKTI